MNENEISVQTPVIQEYQKPSKNYGGKSQKYDDNASKYINEWEKSSPLKLGNDKKGRQHQNNYKNRSKRNSKIQQHELKHVEFKTDLTISQSDSTSVRSDSSTGAPQTKYVDNTLSLAASAAKHVDDKQLNIASAPYIPKMTHKSPEFTPPMTKTYAQQKKWFDIDDIYT